MESIFLKYFYMKKLLLLFGVLALVVFSGCLNEDVVVDEPGGSIDPEVTEEANPIYVGTFEKESVVVVASSELEDDTGYGFAYSPSNVFDLDYSTAWCPDIDDPDPWIRIIFPEEIDFSRVGTVGVVPGFARDETIYFQNNRVKNLELSYGGMGGLSVSYGLEDEYGMQFVEFPNEGGVWSSVVIRARDVYSGSKYDDTCISEIDFWSEWVKLKDAQAALNYYEKYKKDEAIRPVRVESTQFSLPFALEVCGELDLSSFEKISLKDDGYYFEVGDSIVLSAKMNEWASSADELVLKFIERSHFGDFVSEEALEPRVWKSDVVEVKTCGDGDSYVSYEIDDTPIGCLFGECYVEYYYQDRYVGTSPVFSYLQ